MNEYTFIGSHYCEFPNASFLSKGLLLQRKIVSLGRTILIYAYAARGLMQNLHESKEMKFQFIFDV